MWAFITKHCAEAKLVLASLQKSRPLVAISGGPGGRGKSAPGKRLMQAVIGLLSAVAIAPAAAQSTNGCGSGWNAYLVPDSIRVLQCNFKPACDAHDICYGRCEPGAPQATAAQCEYRRCLPKGDLYGSATCESLRYFQLRRAAQGRKSSCDEKFAVDLALTNARAPACSLFVRLYPFAVKVLGDSSFIGGTDLAQTALPASEQAEYAKALNEMFAVWTDAELADFDARWRRGELNLDLLRPVRFSKDRGLYNP